jgi:hypothetical protein
MVLVRAILTITVRVIGIRMESTKKRAHKKEKEEATI